MLTLDKNAKEVFSKASKRATQEKPYVRPVKDASGNEILGLYDVRSSDKKSFYRVEFKKVEGQLTFSCTCKGHQRGLACKHGSACAGHFKLKVAEKSALRATCTEEGCSAPAVDGETFCQNCLQTSEESRLFQQRRQAANFAATVCGECGGLKGGPDADDDHRTCGCSLSPSPIAPGSAEWIALIAKDDADLFGDLPVVNRMRETE